jgi:prephenate dehydrogenase
VLAYALVDLLARLDGDGTLFDFAAGGFQDFTRIAASDPAMWRDICLANRAALGTVLHRYRQDLDALAAAIERGDAGTLEQVFARAKRARDGLNRE